MVDLSEPLAEMLRDFVGGRTSGLVFCKPDGSQLMQRHSSMPPFLFVADQQPFSRFPEDFFTLAEATDLASRAPTFSPMLRNDLQTRHQACNLDPLLRFFRRAFAPRAGRDPRS